MQSDPGKHGIMEDNIGKRKHGIIGSDAGKLIIMKNGVGSIEIATSDT